MTTLLRAGWFCSSPLILVCHTALYRAPLPTARIAIPPPTCLPAFYAVLVAHTPLLFTPPSPLDSRLLDAARTHATFTPGPLVELVNFGSTMPAATFAVLAVMCAPAQLLCVPATYFCYLARASSFIAACRHMPAACCTFCTLPPPPRTAAATRSPFYLLYASHLPVPAFFSALPAFKLPRVPRTRFFALPPVDYRALDDAICACL